MLKNAGVIIRSVLKLTGKVNFSLVKSLIDLFAKTFRRLPASSPRCSSFFPRFFTLLLYGSSLHPFSVTTFCVVVLFSKAGNRISVNSRGYSPSQFAIPLCRVETNGDALSYLHP